MQKSFAFSNIETGYATTNVATKRGITSKTLMLLVVMLLSGIGSGYYMLKMMTGAGEPSIYLGVLIGSIFVSFFAAIIGRMVKRTAKPAAIIYSLSEGIALGAITTLFDLYEPGIGFAAAAATAGIFTVMLALYHFNVIRPTRKFQGFLIGFGISLLVIAIVTSLLYRNVDNFSPVLVLGLESLFIAFGALSLIRNFGELDAIVSMGADKNSEWSCALGLSITLAYIYIYVLRTLFYISRFFRR